MTTLWAHQSDAIKRFQDHCHCALLWDMGTGKTRTAIAWAIRKWGGVSNPRNTLVISPKVTLWNWEREFQAFTNGAINPIVVTGTEKKKQTLLKMDNRVFILNPESLNSDKVVATLRGMSFHTLIVDESHRFKNFKSKRLRALLSISDVIPYRIILTGTPILANYLDIWAQWRIMDCGDTFGKNFYVFRAKYFYDKNASFAGRAHYFPNFMPKPGIAHDISGLMDKKSSRVTKKDCLSLPPLVYVTEFVELGKEQQKIYDEMEKDLVTYINDSVCVATNALTQVLRLLQILSGYAITTAEVVGEKTISLLSDNPRMTRLKEIVEDLTPHHKIIIWASFIENYHALAAMLDEMGIRYAECTGLTRDKQAEIDRFQNDESVRVIVANPSAGGIGISLTAASYSIYYSRSYSLGDRLQSESRNHRAGSERYERITVIDLVARGTIDDEVLRALKNKEDFSKSILERLRK